MNREIRVLIVENDKGYVDLMCSLLKNEGINKIDVVDSYDAAIVNMKKSKYSIVLIDIVLNKDKSGVRLGMHIKENCGTPFMYVTSNMSTAMLEVLQESKPKCIILKPIDEKMFVYNLRITLYNEKVPQASNLELKDRIFVKKNNVYEKIDISEIKYVESHQMYNFIFLKTGERLMIRGGLKDFHERFPETFIKINQRCVINMNYITGYDKDVLVVDNKVLKVSRRYKNKVFDYLISV
ncbi:hypothetical protein DF185_09410 [Marinifilum breve]|uniref:Stage 0 sporulation protein A homolog n=1 Tax=Marinifilum breve TaxID=2184082 RepID=A0A2V3ZYC6_9BACT|nr:LytTR family transcriptional regulator DNA-binding domain-containing protein [Marinifilum breve]PXY01675.1 hypothetical protein DF185_09410 [Marinifilum breve]